ncbi:hypothetical protein ABPG72_021324 [Tetrahymena utriculariae]
MGKNTKDKETANSKTGQAKKAKVTSKEKNKISQSPKKVKNGGNAKNRKTPQCMKPRKYLAAKVENKEISTQKTEKSKKLQYKPTPNTRSNSLKNKLTRQNTFGKLDLLVESQQKENKQNTKQKIQMQQTPSIHEEEEISHTPTFGC